MTSLTIEQLKTNFNHAIDFAQTGKSLAITQDGQPAAILFFLQGRLKTASATPCSKVRGFLSYTVKECPTGRARAVCGRHK